MKRRLWIELQHYSVGSFLENEFKQCPLHRRQRDSRDIKVAAFVANALQPTSTVLTQFSTAFLSQALSFIIYFLNLTILSHTRHGFHFHSSLLNSS